MLVNNAGMTRRMPLTELSDADWRAVLSHQPRQRVLRRPRGGAAHGAARRGAHHQHLLGDERPGAPGHRAVCVEQGRAEDADQGDGGGAGAARHHRQRHRAGLLQDRTDQCLGRRRRLQQLARAAARRARRWGNVEELAPAVVFLASDGAGYVNGHILYVDGGLSPPASDQPPHEHLHQDRAVHRCRRARALARRRSCADRGQAAGAAVGADGQRRLPAAREPGGFSQRVPLHREPAVGVHPARPHGDRAAGRQLARLRSRATTSTRPTCCPPVPPSTPSCTATGAARSATSRWSRCSCGADPEPR